MGNTFITSPDGQKEVVTFFFAKMACHQETGPCKVCLAFCREYITPRAYPVIKHSFLAAVRAGDPDAGFGSIMVSAAAAGPSTAPEEEEEK